MNRASRWAGSSTWRKTATFTPACKSPTNDAVAARITALEGGVAGMLTSSGQAANFYATFNVASAGDHIVSSTAIYGGTFNLFSVTMKKLGIDFTFVRPDVSEEELNAAFRPNTKAVFAETLSNPPSTCWILRSLRRPHMRTACR